MDSFPAEFTADKVFPAPPVNKQLSAIRQSIVNCANRSNFISWNGHLVRSPVCIVCLYLEGMNYRYLEIIDQELSNLKFIVEYRMKNGNTLTFNEIDPFDTMPIQIIIGGANDANHYIEKK